MEYRIIHLDERLVVVDKPSGLLSVPGIGPEKADCLVARVADEVEGARIVHRLDRDTSGVIVLARDAESHRELSRQFQDREVSKQYLAMVIGHPEEDEGRIDLPIRKDLDNTPLQMVDHVHGRPSMTDWSVQQRLEDPCRSRLLLEPLTGRSHQIRLHLQQIGHPILGDDLYADSRGASMAPRLMLHAWTLGFVHPSTAEPMRFESVPPF
ncbi:MAG: RNA pseudouridine synthase [Phycisphaerae bacterium]|nr:RNA pseudouridine synthase [Phycisphaerae bacterium]